MNCMFELGFVCLLFVSFFYSDCWWSEHDAVRVLGFTETTWDNLSGKEPQPAAMRQHWADLTDNEQEALKALNFNRIIWDSQRPESAEKQWDELTQAERQAATTLGFSKTTWDFSSDKLRPSTYFKMWAQMTDAEASALSVLGFIATNWDNSPMQLPESVGTPWSLLTTCGEIQFVLRQI